MNEQAARLSPDDFQTIAVAAFARFYASTLEVGPGKDYWPLLPEASRKALQDPWTASRSMAGRSIYLGSSGKPEGDRLPEAGPGRESRQ